MNQKKLITILATITIIAILSVSLFFTQFSAATATTYNANKMTVNGVLASDSYVLFPFDNASLIFGFSKYGELINGEVGQAYGQGLEYKGMDVFANPNVLERDWSQGWLIDIHYVDGNNNYKRAWAFALYSDLTGTTGIGGDWNEECTARDGSDGKYGGRKTNVWAKTDPIEVLYDGPRRFVALTKTILYGASTKTPDDELVSITITFVFNKDKKQVTLFKDIKKLDKGKFGSTFQVEFSNRGEWDIGTAASPPSYAHFYDNLTTLYGNDYHDFYSDTGYNLTGFDMCQMIDEGGSYVGWAAYWPQLYGKDVEGTSGAGDKITFAEIRSSLCTKEYNNTWLELGAPANKQIIFGNYTWPNATSYPTGLGDSTDAPMVFKNGVHLPSNQYIWTSPNNITLTTTAPAETDYITIVYKHELNNETKDTDVNEPNTPYVIGEWCFDLKNEEYKRQFRAVTVYGLTDRHDAQDKDAYTDSKTWATVNDNVIDSEVQYYLNETFNPYDLYSAVHKQTKRDVEFFEGDDITTDFELEYIPIGLVDWDAYCTFAERVLVDEVLAYPYRANATFGFYNYTLCKWPDPAGWGINFTEAPADGAVIKVLYSYNETEKKVDVIEIEAGDIPVDTEKGYQLSHWPIKAKEYVLNSSAIIPAGCYAFNDTTLNDGIIFFKNATNAILLPDNYTVVYDIWSGSYEWIVVGTDAASIANVGAAYVAEAFDSIKDIAVLKTGMDIRETTWGPNAPYVMSGPGTRLRSNYYDSLGRSHLKDDWCTTYPIASSDMIFIGGPRATLGTEYFNEFTNAFFAESEWVVNNTGQANKILALTCWNRTTYFNNATTGYAQISVYKDLNGTIGFLVWGLNGDDGLYAAEWFWNYPAGITCPDGTIVYSGIEYLQHENRGVTDIILKITYPTADPTHPTMTIKERLGTISEKTPHDC